MKYLIVIVLGALVLVWLVRDYQARMVVHNASYQCMYGDVYACEFLSQEALP